MFNELNEALRIDKFYRELDEVGERMRRAGIKYGCLSRWSKDKPEKLDESKIGELQDLALKCVDGAEELDRVIQVFKAMRDNLARHVFEIRDAFPGFNARVTEEMKNFAKEEKSNVSVCRKRGLLAKFLGYYELPDNFVDVDLFMDRSNVVASFGIKGKPTRVGIGIPTESDFSNSYRFYRMDDEELGFSDVGVGELKELVPMLIVAISAGAGNGDSRTMTFRTVDAVKGAIERLFAYDVRDSIKKVGSLSEVTSAEDFSAWRMCRFANRRAAENSWPEVETVR